MADAGRIPNDDDNWARLQREYVELRASVQEETDATRRAALVERLRQTREAIAELDDARAAAAQSALARAEERARTAAADLPPLTTTARDQALSMHRRGEPVPTAEERPAAPSSGTPGVDSRRLLLILAAAITAVAVAVVGVALALRGGDDGEAAGPDSSVGPMTVSNRDLQQALDEVVIPEPIRFASGERVLPDGSGPVVERVAELLLDAPGLEITIVGHGDNAGDLEGIGLVRADSVRAALVAAGVDGEQLSLAGAAAAGDLWAPTGADGHIGFSVAGTEIQVEELTRIVLVTPVDVYDEGAMQAMSDTLAGLAASRDDIELLVEAGTVTQDALGPMVGGYAEQGYDLVILHGYALDEAVVDAARANTALTIAVGPVPPPADVLPGNVYPYDAASEQGGYVMGVTGSYLTSSGRIAAVGTDAEGDDARFLQGFQAGVLAVSPEAEVVVDLAEGAEAGEGMEGTTPSGSDLARGQFAAGADVLAGTGFGSSLVLAAGEAGAFWFGNQMDLNAVAPGRAVASQVYHWEVVLGEVLLDIEAGNPQGRPLALTLANGGLVVEFNSATIVPVEALDRANEAQAEIIRGEVQLVLEPLTSDDSDDN